MEALLFFTTFVFGFFPQTVSYMLMIFAFNKSKVTIKQLFFYSIVVAFICYAIRLIPFIGFGLHTILNIVVFILFATLWLKKRVYPTVVSVLITTMFVIFCEYITFSVLSLALSPETLNELIVNIETVSDEIRRVLLGGINNIIVLGVSCFIYKLKLKER